MFVNVPLLAYVLLFVYIFFSFRLLNQFPFQYRFNTHFFANYYLLLNYKYIYYKYIIFLEKKNLKIEKIFWQDFKKCDFSTSDVFGEFGIENLVNFLGLSKTLGNFQYFLMTFWIFLIFLECPRKCRKIKKIKKNT